MIDTKRSEGTESELEFMPLSEAATLTGYTPEYLNLLSRKKKIQAKKIGRNWYTKKEWVDEFLAKVAKVSEEETPDASSASEAVQKSSEYFDTRKERTVLESYFTEKELSEMKEKGVSFKNSERENAKDKKDESARETRQENVWEVAGDTKEAAGNWLKIFAVMSSAIIILPLLFAGSKVVKVIATNSQKKSELAKVYSDRQNFQTEILNENSENGKVAGIETTQVGSGAILASANFKINSINVGGNTLVLSNEDTRPLTIENIKSDSFADNKKNETSLVVAWQTNKMSLSELNYSKAGGQNPATLAEDSFGFNHSAVVSGLEPGASYVFQIKSKDRWANEISSDFFGVYTASKPVSVFDLISNAVGEVFGWAIKK